MPTKKIDLSPQELDLVLYSGDGVKFRLVVTDKNNEPINLTGGIEAQIRSKRGEDVEPAAEFDVDLTDADTGIVVLSLTGDQTKALADTRAFAGFWDVQWTPSGEEPRTFCQGKVECNVDVSR